MSLEVTAKVVIYEAFVDGRLAAPKTLPGLFVTFTSSRNTKDSAADHLESLERFHFCV